MQTPFRHTTLNGLSNARRCTTLHVLIVRQYCIHIILVQTHVISCCLQSQRQSAKHSRQAPHSCTCPTSERPNAVASKNDGPSNCQSSNAHVSFFDRRPGMSIDFPLASAIRTSLGVLFLVLDILSGACLPSQGADLGASLDWS